MKKIADFMRKWSFILVLILWGGFYLTYVDEWQVYGKEWSKVKEIYDGNQNDRDEPQQKVLSGEESLNAPSEMNENNEEIVPGENLPQPDAQEDGETGEGMYHTVEDDYFADAAFIGDSRTVGMFEYGGLEEISTFYASKGLTIYKLFDAPIVSVEGKKQKITIEEALSNRQFSKIYLMVGINEMGTGTVDTFLAKYKEVVEHLQELQPDAVIYVQGIIKVTTERSGEGDYITNEGIEARNQGLELLADNEKVFYLDVNPLICDETGGMVDSYTYDGVHLKAQYIPIWKDFLKCHACSGV